MFLPSSNSPAGLLGNQQEESSSSSAAKIIEKPGTFDILCGKDKTFNKHHGNRIFREMIVSYHDVYAKAGSKHEKMQITKEIVSTLQSKYNARFIKSISSNSSSSGGRQGGKDGAQWQEISNQVARDKVSHALRFASRPSGVAGTAAGSGSGSGSASCLSAPPRTLTALASSSSHSSNSNNNNHNSSRTRQCRRSRSCTATLTSLQAATAASATAAPFSSTSWHTVSNNCSTGSVPGVIATTTPLGPNHTTTAATVTNNSMSTLRSTARSGSFNLFYGNRRSRATLAAVAALTAFDAAAFQTPLGDDEDVEPNPHNEAVVSDWDKSHNSSESSAFFEEHTYDPDQLQYNHHSTYNDDKDDIHMVHCNQHDRKQEIMTTDEEEVEDDDEQDDTETADEEDLTLSSNSVPHYLDLEPTPLPVHSRQFFLLPQHHIRQPPGNQAGTIADATVLSPCNNDDEAIDALMKEPVIY